MSCISTVYRVALVDCDVLRSIAGLVTYFVVGSLVNKVHFHKSGTEIIPNKDFWVAVPFLIKVKLAMSLCEKTFNVYCPFAICS